MKHTVLIILAIFTQIVSNGRANEEDFIPPLLMYYGGGSIAGLLVPRNEMSHGQIVWRNLLSEGELGDVTLYRKSSESVEWNLSDSGNDAVNLSFDGDERIVNDRASDGVTTIYHLSPNNSGFCIPGNWYKESSPWTNQYLHEDEVYDFLTCHQQIVRMEFTNYGSFYGRENGRCYYIEVEHFTSTPDQGYVGCKYQINPIPESYGRGGVPTNVGITESLQECVEVGDYDVHVNGISYSTGNKNCITHIGMISIQFTDSAEITVQDWQTAFLFPNYELRMNSNEDISSFIMYVKDNEVGLLVPRNERNYRRTVWRDILRNGQIGTVLLQKTYDSRSIQYFDLEKIDEIDGFRIRVNVETGNVVDDTSSTAYVYNLKPELSGFCIPALGTSTVMRQFYEVPNAATLSDCIEDIRHDITDGNHYHEYGHITGLMWSLDMNKCHGTAPSDSELNVEDLQPFISCEFQINRIPNSYGRGNEDVDFGRRSFDECVGTAYNDEDVSGISHSQTEDCIGHTNMTSIQLTNSTEIVVENWQTAFLSPIYRVPVIPKTQSPFLMYVGNTHAGVLSPTDEMYYGCRVWRNSHYTYASLNVMLRKKNINEWELHSSPSRSLTFAGKGGIVPHGTLSDNLLSDYGNTRIYHLDLKIVGLCTPFIGEIRISGTTEERLVKIPLYSLHDISTCLLKIVNDGGNGMTYDQESGRCYSYNGSELKIQDAARSYKVSCIIGTDTTEPTTVTEKSFLVKVIAINVTIGAIFLIGAALVAGKLLSNRQMKYRQSSVVLETGEDDLFHTVDAEFDMTFFQTLADDDEVYKLI